MKPSTLASAALPRALLSTLLVFTACGADDPAQQDAPAAPDAGAPGHVASGEDASSLDPDAASPGPDAAGPTDASLTTAMPRISAGAPAFASGSAGQGAPSRASDDDMQTAWVPDHLPAWIAYDLSGAPAALRQSVLAVWNAEHAGSYLNASPPSGAQMPTDYTIEINGAPGGTAAPPTSGWTVAATVHANLRNTVQHPVTLGGGNWIRMNITAATDANVAVDFDVYGAPGGATDSWLLMGDSITYITMGYAFSDLPRLVHQAASTRWPAVINAAIGGTNTTTALAAIDETMTGFPGRYVVLAYGTNDHPNELHMEELIQKVLAAGKIPVVPHMPWSSSASIQTSGPLINQAIDALYARYPQLVAGPDLWAAFTNRTALIPPGDVHPNGAGQEFLRQQWATTMAAVR